MENVTIICVCAVRPGKVKSLKVRSSSENTADNFVNFEAPAKRSITYNIIVSCDRDGFHLVRCVFYILCVSYMTY